MAQVLVRRMDDDAVERLRARARRGGRSLEEECRIALASASRRGGLIDAIDQWRALWPQDGEGDDPFDDLRARGPGRNVDLE
jgi:hypothetical protein